MTGAGTVEITLDNEARVHEVWVIEQDVIGILVIWISRSDGDRVSPDRC